jgi:Castor and Pollux, part of voltage-gated ion channel
MVTTRGSGERVTVGQRIRYRLDNALLRGSVPVLGWLVAVTLAVVALAAAAMWITGWGPADERTSFLESVWLALTRSLDPGTFGGDEGTRFRLITLLVTLAGLLILATLVGLATTGIDRRLDELRRGHSFVVEEGHQLILGWSSLVPRIVSELAEANAVFSSVKRPAIVVLTERKATEVEHDIRSVVRDMRGSRLVVRNGDPSLSVDLQLVRPTQARSIIVVSPERPDPDAQVVRIAMALQQFPAHASITASGRRPTVMELRDPAIARSLDTGLRTMAEHLDGVDGSPPPVIRIPQEVVGHITARVLRNRGLSSIYEDLLDFQGQEFYLRPKPDWSPDAVYGDVVLSWPRACVVGVVDVDGNARLAPPLDLRLSSVESLIVLAEDDDPRLFSNPKHEPVATDSQSPAPRVEPVASEGRVVRVLIIGWNAMGDKVLEQLTVELGERLEVTIAFDPTRVSERVARHLHSQGPSISAVHGDTAESAFIDSLFAAPVPYDHVLVLCYRGDLSEDDAEAHTLLTLLHVRNAVLRPGQGANVVTELLRAQDEEVAGGLAAPDDFIVSDRLTALLLTQISETPILASVFEDLFDVAGSDIVLRTPEQYGLGAQFSFVDAVREAARRGESAIGWHLAEPESPRRPISQLNPPKKYAQRSRDTEVLGIIAIGPPRG